MILIQDYSIETSDVPKLSKDVRDMASCAHCMSVCMWLTKTTTTIHKIQLRSSEQNEDRISLSWQVPGVPESLYSEGMPLDCVYLHALKQILILDKYGRASAWIIQLHEQPWHAIPVMGDMYVFSYSNSESEEKEDRVCPN